MKQSDQPEDNERYVMADLPDNDLQMSGRNVRIQNNLLLTSPSSSSPSVVRYNVTFAAENKQQIVVYSFLALVCFPGKLFFP